MNVFTRAEFSANLDSRGRVTVPSRYREQFNLGKGDRVKLIFSRVRKVSRKVENTGEAQRFVSSFQNVESFSFNGETVEVLIRE